ncbi:MAG: IS110 family transposase [Acidobacteria bacterium]|nr:IS110 family transposase [Acidobacteriota bacterium]
MRMWEKALTKQFRQMYPKNVLSTIPGVSEHGAAGIMAMTGDFRHYSPCNRLMAFVGLDPHANDSGDAVGHHWFGHSSSWNALAC